MSERIKMGSPDSTRTSTDGQEWDGAPFPCVMVAGGKKNLSSFISEHLKTIDNHLSQSGAVLFREFDVADASGFDAAVSAYGADNFPYAESLSNAVRVNVTPRVFTANEAPPATSIYLHHEMAQTPIFPSKLFFFCEIAPESGGQTPLCRSDVLYRKLADEKPAIVEKYASKGVRYRHSMPAENDSGSGQGRSWKSTLGVTTKEDAEKRLTALAYDWVWGTENALTVTSPVLPAIRTLSDGRRVFFNQLIAAWRGWADKRNEPAKSVMFGDNTAIESADMIDVIAISEALTFDLAWRAGDVVLVDNYLVMHARRPFEGRRRVLASLIK